MEPNEYRRRAGGAVAERMQELGLTTTQLAEKAGVDPTTVRAFINGTRMLRDETRCKLLTALGWGPNELARRAWALANFETGELVGELCSRLNQDHHVR